MDRLAEFMENASKDDRILPTHISLFAAICCMKKDENSEGIKVTRRELMRYGCIKAISTYHIILADLQAFGYIVYKPSFHPIKGSLVYLT
ncbi:hypothetical protein GM921_09970 [Pedobacter sp. LMG 31464]|uniref:Uncharacterized protein n=1 Tax=Pedobacter planticolens TaxID=2679964 RepID=A0A923IW44_9SPHI|nr:hypothetical protein [Pedobacter planticolens]MBB2145814.1 hypothetical protein [Pedobacter planticolens]